MGWTLRGLALLGVSVLSGLLWLAITDSSEEAEPKGQGPRTEHDFAQVLRVDGQQQCADVSTGDIRDFFIEQQRGCEHLTRALYTTTLDDGQRVLTSVVAVRMSDPSLAAELNKQVTKDQTGNIQDLVNDEGGYNLPSDFPGLTQDVGFHSQQQGRLLVVGESGYFGKPDTREDKRLKGITEDALKLASKQDSN